MGYKNPQRVIDKSFDAFTQASKRWVGQIAATTKEIHDRNAKAKKDQQLEWEKANEAQQTMYSKVNELGSSGNSAFDENLRSFWDNRVDQYFEIKNQMSRGDMDQKEGNKLLSQIMGEVDKFQKIVPYVAQQCALQREHGKKEPGTAGAISSVTPQDSQNVFNNILNGGDTALVEKGGVMYLYNPPINGKQEGAMVNLDELYEKTANGADIVQLVPDISKDLSKAYENIFKPNDVNSEYIAVDEVKDGAYTYEYKRYKTAEELDGIEPKDKGIQAMIDGGQFDPMLQRDNMMNSIWQDMIPDEYIKANGGEVDSNWHEADPSLNGDPDAQKAKWAEQDALAKKWMAEQAYDQNSELDQTRKFLNKYKTPTNNPSSSSSSSTTPKPASVNAGVPISTDDLIADIGSYNDDDYVDVIDSTTGKTKKVNVGDFKRDNNL